MDIQDLSREQLLGHIMHLRNRITELEEIISGKYDMLDKDTPEQKLTMEREK